MAPIRQSSNRRQSVGQLVATPPWEVLLQRTSKRTLDHSRQGSCLHTTIYWRFGREARWSGLLSGFSSRLGILFSICFDIHTVIFHYRSNSLKAYDIIAARLLFRYFKTSRLHDATVPRSSNASAWTFQNFPLLRTTLDNFSLLHLKSMSRPFRIPPRESRFPFASPSPPNPHQRRYP